MFTVRQIRETLELSSDETAKSIVLSLKVNHRWDGDKNNDLLLFDLSEQNIFYSNIYDKISYVLQEFRGMEYGITRLKGLTVSQIGWVLGRDIVGEPWPDIVIATAIQYQLLKIENKFFSISQIMDIKFFNLDVRHNEQLYHCQKM